MAASGWCPATAAFIRVGGHWPGLNEGVVSNVVSGDMAEDMHGLMRGRGAYELCSCPLCVVSTIVFETSVLLGRERTKWLPPTKPPPVSFHGSQ